jgi:hypothetical protein
MQREVIDGVPYLVSKEGNVFYYAFTPESTHILIGTRSADGKLCLFDNWKQLLASQLLTYRTELTGRSRKARSG